MKKLLLLVSLVVAYYLFIKPESKLTSAFSHQQLMDIKPDVIIDDFTLISEDGFKLFKNDINNSLVEAHVLVPTHLGLAINRSKLPHTINVIIESGGGYVPVGYNIANYMTALKQIGVFISCYVSEAQSMAFFIMIKGCSRVKATKDVILMQHRTSYGVSGTTPGTYMIDIEMAKEESSILGIEFDKWLHITRGSDEDHVFSKKEIKKYKLVQDTL